MFWVLHLNEVFNSVEVYKAMDIALIKDLIPHQTYKVGVGT